MNCFGMVKSYFEPDYNFTESDEFRLLEESFRFDRECYEPYLIDKLKNSFNVEVIVESDYLYWKYGKLSEDLSNDIEPIHKILSREDYIAAVEEGLAIVLLDKWFLDMYTHFAHWVVVSDYEQGNFMLNDSWTGRKIDMSENRFMESVKSLRQILNCSPILIEVGENQS